MELQNRTDEELVRLYAMNDNAVFDELLKRYKSKVFSYIYASTKDTDVANDIFQDTFVKAITTIKQGGYTEKGKFGPWILRIAHNLVIDSFRKTKSDNTVSNDDYEVDLLNDIKLCDDGLEEYWQKENMINDVIDLIDQLPENQQTIVRMRFFKEMSFKDIAVAENISINTALGRIRYALINLKKLAAENKVGVDY